MRIALAVSVFANFVFLAFVGAFQLQLGVRHRDAASQHSASPPTAEPPHAAARLRAANSQTGLLTADIIAELKHAGLPRDTLVAVVLADASRRSLQEMRALEARYAPRLVPERELTALTRRQENERRRAVRDALGEEAFLAWDKEQTLLEVNRGRGPEGALPMSVDDAEQAYRVQKEFDAKTRELEMAVEDGVVDRDDATKLRSQYEQARDHGLVAFLGQDRFDALHKNDTPLASVYQTFGDLDPTPDQAYAVLQIDRGLREGEANLAKRLADNPDNSDPAADWQAIADARDAAYRALFGDDRYAQFKREHDATYQTLERYAGAWNLDPNQIQQVYGSVNAFEQSAERLRAVAALTQQAGRKVDWDAVNSAIDQLKQQTMTAVGGAVGPDKLHRMQVNGLF